MSSERLILCLNSQDPQGNAGLLVPLRVHFKGKETEARLPRITWLVGGGPGPILDSLAPGYSGPLLKVSLNGSFLCLELELGNDAGVGVGGMQGC